MERNCGNVKSGTNGIVALCEWVWVGVGMTICVSSNPNIYYEVLFHGIKKKKTKIALERETKKC